ncbi:MAG TPA: alpha-xylosidase [Roseiflexaceae bacterium]|nr:alpha-xylosidase [Roseiflexaceae bacterium]
MKFTDGNWLMRPGVRAFYPAHAYDLEAGAGTLTAYAPTRRIAHRGDTLGGPLLTVELSAPLPDVLRVRLSHLHGAPERGPHFPLQSDPAHTAQVADDGTAATLTSGRLSARIARGDSWRLDFLADGRPLTSSGPRSMGIIQQDDGGRFIHEQLSLGVGEYVYGLGERFSAFVKNGQTVEIWNKDGGTGSEQAYKNIPFYLTNRGYGVFVNQPELVAFEVASERVSRVQFSVEGQALEYVVIYGPDPKAILEKYTALTGRPALPPSWSFGLWLSTSFTTSYDEATVTSFIQGMADRDLPLHVFHFDCFWMREFNWCDFVWDPRTFPDPAGMLARLKARGLRICLWINPYIAQRSPLFAEGRAAGYLLKRPDGGVWQTDLWQPGMGIVDFTNPDASRWFADKLRALLDMGVDCFKTDFGERIPTDAVYHDGADPQGMHNYYALLYNRVVFEVLEERRGRGEAVVFARSATAGGQQYPVHWGGDSESTFESMAESLRGGLSLGLCGFGFWSHDIGGFEGTPPAEVYKRWIAFGLLSSHSRLHGSHSYRVPWLFDEEAVAVLRHFTQLKCRLMPYLYAAAHEAHARGVPVMRAMLLEFPGDPTCDLLDRQYMLGDALLVAPVFSYDGRVVFYLPAGRWTRLETGETLEGPRWVEEIHGMLSLPLLVRPGAVLPVGARDDRPDYDYGDGLTLEVYGLGDGVRSELRIPAGGVGQPCAFELRREGRTLLATRTGAPGPWRLLLIGTGNVGSVRGGSFASDPRGVLVTADTDTLEILLGETDV